MLQWIYQFVGNYGWSIILFTVIVRLLSFPLQIKQQKSTARMAAYQPMIQEIQKKYAKDKEKQNEELMRMQQEYGYNPAAGCAPMLINFLVIFGIIEVVYRPLKYIMHLSAEALNAAASQLGMAANNYMAQSEIIKQVQLDPNVFGNIFTAEQIEAMQNFNVKMCIRDRINTVSSGKSVTTKLLGSSSLRVTTAPSVSACRKNVRVCLEIEVVSISKIPMISLVWTT